MAAAGAAAGGHPSWRAQIAQEGLAPAACSPERLVTAWGGHCMRHAVGHSWAMQPEREGGAGQY